MNEGRRTGAAPGTDRRLPAVFTIASTEPFLDVLAASLIAEAAGEPLALARMQVLLPTRRACRSMQEALLRQSDGRPLLLPRLSPLGDLDADEAWFAGQGGDPGGDSADLAPAISPLRRLLLLTRLVMARDIGGEAPAADQAARLAQELVGLLDQAQIEELSFDGLEALVTGDHAQHWQETLRFLAIVTETWPKILAEQHCLDPAERRGLLIRARAQAWRRQPPTGPVIAAGSTGSIPATADLLATIARLPQGRVVLPGLDGEADADTWGEIERDAAHPQHGLARLLSHLKMTRDDVRAWPAPTLGRTPPARARLVAEALRPATTTEAWHTIEPDERQRLAAALKQVTRVDCATPQEEATVIALLLREALLKPGRAAVVTPDRALARRVAAELLRWDIRVDDSGGQPLAHTPPGAFLRLTATMVAEDAAPVALLAALKHPLAAGGMEPVAFRTLTRRLEKTVLRGPRPAPGFAGLRAAIAAAKIMPAEAQSLTSFVARLEALAQPFSQALAGEGSLAALLRAHVDFAEALSLGAGQTAADRLWLGPAGEAAADFVAALATAELPGVAGARYPALLDSLMQGHVVRPRWGHPRLALWGPLEARLQQADLVILAGLNEGTWPAEPLADPWLNRPMRLAFGLPAPERRIGQAAHDFAQAFAAPEVVLTRSKRVESDPTVPSRWLLRLDAFLETLDLQFDLHRPATLRAWAGLLDGGERVAPLAPPAPTPPLAARPRTLSFTTVETWLRDPYAIYARQILRLEALDDIDTDPGPAEHGNLVHGALEKFVRAYPDTLPEDALEKLLAMGRDVFATNLARPAVWAFWWPRFERIARWFVDQEASRRRDGCRSIVEARGRLLLPAPGGAFELHGRADRIDRLADGTLAIIDYKTGTAPTTADVISGFASQLPLEAAVAEAGGFDGVAAAPASQLAYWRLSGRDPAGEILPVKDDAMALAEKALAGLGRLIACFDDPATPYFACPRPSQAPRYNDYEHLERVKEWSVGPGNGE